MKEYPILFSAPMIKALLDGRKTVTRRISKQWTKVNAGDHLWVQEATESYPLPDLLTGDPTRMVAARYTAMKRERQVQFFKHAG